MRTFSFHAMGSQIMVAQDGTPAAFADTQKAVESWFEEWEQTFSRFRLTSELSEVNRHTGTFQSVSGTFWEVLKVALHMEKITDGLVTPLILNALEEAGYTRSFDEMPEFMETYLRQTIIGVKDSQEVELNENDHSIYLPAGARIDLGGIVKGWAAHKAMLRLQEFGPVMVDAGGDIAISGPLKDGSPWAIGISDPLHDGQSLSIMMLSGGGIATSGRDYRRWVNRGQRQHHIIDPRIDAPAETDVLSATVTAPNVIQAEAWAKTALILGSAGARDRLEKLAGIEYFLVHEDGQTSESYGFGINRWSEKWQQIHSKLLA